MVSTPFRVTATATRMLVSMLFTRVAGPVRVGKLAEPLRSDQGTPALEGRDVHLLPDPPAPRQLLEVLLGRPPDDLADRTILLPGRLTQGAESELVLLPEMPFHLNGWDPESGNPTPVKLRELGLGWAAELP